jgi:hypothetical protein
MSGDARRYIWRHCDWHVLSRCGADAFFPGVSGRLRRIDADKIAQALSAAPPDVAREAKVAEVDSRGRIIKVLREGSNGFTCMPGDPKQVGRPAMCADKASMQWSNDFLQHSQNRPTLPRASFTCWLALRSEVTPIRMTRQVRPLRLVPIG